MKTHIRLLSSLTLSALLFLTACDSSDPDAGGSPVVAQRAADIPSDPITGIGSDGRPVGQNAYTFFSLRSGQIVARADSATTGWDLAFKGTTILINGGTSGPGNGAAQVMEGLFDEVNEAPADGWTQDGANGYAIPTGSGNGWYSYNPATQTVLPLPGRVLVIRTADGRFAKVSMVSYYQGAPATPIGESTARYLTFDYVFQPDGSRSFE
ncbi:MAG: HmuY family protein [Bacteroidetes bacterium]|nr:HmuY family protein [Bacteroidota bacterium]